MNAEAANAILNQWGAFGAILIVTWLALGWWILKQRSDIREARAELAALHAQRATELSGTTDRVLKLAEAHNAVQQAQALATQAVAERLDAVDTSIREFSVTRRK